MQRSADLERECASRITKISRYFVRSLSNVCVNSCTRGNKKTQNLWNGWKRCRFHLRCYHVEQLFVTVPIEKYTFRPLLRWDGRKLTCTLFRFPNNDPDQIGLMQTTRYFTNPFSRSRKFNFFI